MSLKQRAIDCISKTGVGERAVRDRRYRILLTATGSLVLNISYALYHGALGVLGGSWWFLAMCAYYTILGMTRFAAVLCERKTRSAPSVDTEYFIMRVCGILLLLLNCVMAGVNYMSLSENIAVKYGEITMITIATYTFTKLSMCIYRAIKYRRDPSPLLSAIRGIGYAEVSASMLTMQRSMLVSFGDMSQANIRLMNSISGAMVFVFICVLGIKMIKESRGKQ